MNTQFLAFGTYNTIRVEDDIPKEVLMAARQLALELDDRLSPFKPGSEISRINRAAGVGPVRVSSGTYRLIEKAIEWSGLSNGAFDMTIRPATQLWGIGKKGSFIPDSQSLKNLMPLVDYRKILLDHKAGTVMLLQSGMSIDLGGIGKGYAADLIGDLLKQNGVRHAMINAGGNLVSVGGKSDEVPWHTGIQNPLMVRGNILGTMPLCDASLVTSGVNERFFIKSGRRYHHLLDPITLQPVDNDLLSVTVIGQKSVDLDALSTAVFVMGPESGAELARKSGCDVLFVMKDHSIVGTARFMKDFKIEENDNVKYKKSK